MNSLMFANQLCSKLIIANAAALNVDQAVTVLAAMNKAIKEWIDGLPGRYKVTNRTEYMPDPVTGSMTVSTGATDCTLILPSGYYDTAERLTGHAVSLENDIPVINRFETPTSLLNPSLSNQTSQTITIWGDSVLFTSDQTKVTNPKWTGTDGRVQTLQKIAEPIENSLMDRARFEFGSPRYWQTSPFNPLTQGNKWLLSVWPLPISRGLLSFQLETQAPTLDFDALQVPVSIPIADNQMPSVIAIGEEWLLGSPLWSKDADKGAVIKNAATARTALMALWRPLDSSTSRIETPDNF